VRDATGKAGERFKCDFDGDEAITLGESSAKEDGHV
jgi:hypothetical protein